MTGLLANVGTELVWQVVLTGFALVLAIVPGVLLLQRRPVSPALLALGPGVAALAVTAMGRAALVGWGADPARLVLQQTTFAAVHLLSPLTVGPVVLVAVGLQAFAGARAAPRRWPIALVVLALALLAGAIVVTGGQATANPIYAWIRAVAYAVVGGWCAVGALGGGSAEGGGPDAGAAATAVFPLVVAIGEASERGVVDLLVGQQPPLVQADLWDEAVRQLLAAVAPEWRASLAALAVASVVAAIGAGAAWRSPRRAHALGGAALWVAAAWTVLLLSELGPARLAALAALCPAVLAPVP